MTLLKSYYELCKPNVVYMMLICAFVGMLLAEETVGSFWYLFISLSGIAFCAASAAALPSHSSAEQDHVLSLLQPKAHHQKHTKHRHGRSNTQRIAGESNKDGVFDVALYSVADGHSTSSVLDYALVVSACSLRKPAP